MIKRAGIFRRRNVFWFMQFIWSHKKYVVDAPKKKKGRRFTSHRYNHLPLLPSGPGGVQRELVV
jgi:hypothetical protein